MEGVGGRKRAGAFSGDLAQVACERSEVLKLCRKLSMATAGALAWA